MIDWVAIGVLWVAAFVLAALWLAGNDDELGIKYLVCVGAFVILGPLSLLMLMASLVIAGACLIVGMLAYGASHWIAG
jgi:hypothetical protein